ncbi:hypothetical protein Gpo141_00009859 [Globisporangium polare]
MAGGEASAIYEHFAHTPLKIRPQRRRGDTDAAVGATGGIEKGRQEKSQLLDVSSVAVKLSFASPSGPSPPLSPTPKKAREAQVPAHVDAPVSKRCSASSAAALGSEGELVKAKKTREHEASATTAATFKADAELSTPQKIPMSSKKGLARKSRNPATPKPARRSLRIQLSLPDADIPANYITVACDELLETNTVSGALFSVALNSLRDLQEEFLEAQVGRTSSDPVPNPFQPVRSLCMGIAACERRAESHNESSVKSTLLIRRRGPKSATTKKSVRFQSFDLSCLNLHYVRDAHTEALVDKIIFSYDEIMSSIAPMLQQVSAETSAPHTFEIKIFQEVVRALNDKSMLYINPDTLATEAERVYLAAFGSKDPHMQHEIQVSRSYYAREFKKLATTNESSPPGAHFLQDMFSSLVSSSMRFKLRALFLEYESDKSERDQPSVSMATYTHQDFGSAVHCALQESLLYEPLAAPVIALLNEKSRLMKHLENTAMDDFEHIEQYNFEDEAHFFPLASVEDFIAELEAQEPAFLQLESSVGDFYDEKKGSSWVSFLMLRLNDFDCTLT